MNNDNTHGIQMNEGELLDTLNSMQQVCQKLYDEIEEINRSLVAFPGSLEILNDLNGILKIDQDVEMKDQSENTPQNHNITSNLERQSPRTPKSALKKSIVDFDAFPHTPTLEQLGISEGALALMGEGRAKSKLAHISDSDSDYKLSPSHSMAFSNINSIPSTCFETFC